MQALGINNPRERHRNAHTPHTHTPYQYVSPHTSHALNRIIRAHPPILTAKNSGFVVIYTILYWNPLRVVDMRSKRTHRKLSTVSTCILYRLCYSCFMEYINPSKDRRQRKVERLVFIFIAVAFLALLGISGHDEVHTLTPHATPCAHATR